MDNNDYENNFEQVLRDGVNNMLDAMAENVAKKIAHDIIDMVEEELKTPAIVARKPLIYMKIVECLEKHVEKMSGEVKVEE